MADGDAALAAGLAVFPPTQDLKQGYNNDNIRGDELAAEKAARVAGDALAFPAAKIKIQTSTPTVVTGGIWFKPVS